MMNLEILQQTKLSWLNTNAEEGDIALYSKLRIGRNFKGIPFPNRADMEELEYVLSTVQKQLPAIERLRANSFTCISMEEITRLEREVLLEKQLISEVMTKELNGRAAIVEQTCKMDILVNDGDHLRIQCFAPGLDLEMPFSMAYQIDDIVEANLDFAFDEKFGYLAADPMNLGTAMRASVFLHLPGLVYTRNIQAVMQMTQQLGVFMRAIYGDGKDVIGNMFQLSNQQTLGLDEREIIEKLKGVVTEVIARERRARKALSLYRKEYLEDELWRTYGILKYARSLQEKEALELISKLRFGLDLGIVDALKTECFSELLFGVQTRYLEYRAGNENLSQLELAKLRAETVHEILERYEIKEVHP